jgi:hypothetical protein
MRDNMTFAEEVKMFGTTELGAQIEIAIQLKRIADELEYKRINDLEI